MTVKITFSIIEIEFGLVCAMEDICKKIPLGNILLYDIEIITKYYYDETSSSECIIGKVQKNITYFPNIITFCCRTKGLDSNEFKLRWIYSDNHQKIHFASSLKQKYAKNILSRFVNKLEKCKLRCEYIRPVEYVVTNGYFKVERIISLDRVVEKIENTPGIIYLYSDNRKLLNLYIDEGTVSISSNGKIVYLGTKTERSLEFLHSKIEKMVI